MIKRLLIFALLFGIVSICAPPCQANEIILGIHTFKGPVAATKDWTATAEYLSAKLGKTFKMVPLTDDQLREGVSKGKVDFFFCNNTIYAELNKLSNAQAIATMVKSYKGRTTEFVASAIIVRRDSPIKSLADFKGKSIIVRGKSSFGGWIVAKRLFLERGIVPERDLKEVRETTETDNLIWAVLNRAVDGAATISGILEEMVDAGKVKMEDFRVIEPVSDSLFFAHSSPLYPDFPMAASAHVPANLKNEVAQALFNLTESDKAAKDAKIAGWKKPSDYAPVMECLTAVQYGPFGKK
ncbi:MAG: PhnD/SsuA/transferrin family substrate-binding protein [Syntrophobacter sp.]